MAEKKALTTEALTIVGLTAAECYGVVGMRAGGIARLLPRDRTKRGIEIGAGEQGLQITLHVVVEHGLNLAEVASTDEFVGTNVAVNECEPGAMDVTVNDAAPAETAVVPRRVEPSRNSTEPAAEAAG